MFGLGLPELLVILLILLLIFGANKLPKLSRSLGESARELRKGLNGDDAPDNVKAKKTSSSKSSSKKTTKND
ncbi:twin-arginine translocase TatA/TatE family subunit [Candidatus Saccharibacteria bacterium]|nr:twin-arginine translocase TatA/TatE family subunit [Candidatus Saccharibacteria bacterium]